MAQSNSPQADSIYLSGYLEKVIKISIEREDATAINDKRTSAVFVKPELANYCLNNISKGEK